MSRAVELAQTRISTVKYAKIFNPFILTKTIYHTTPTQGSASLIKAASKWQQLEQLDGLCNNWKGTSC